MHSQKRVIRWLTLGVAMLGCQAAWAWAPVAANDSYTTGVNTTLTVGAPGVLANDSDPDGQALTAVRMTNPSHGTLAFNANGSFTYRPATNYTGTDSFTYKASDGQNRSSAATVTIKVVQTIVIVTPPANQAVCPGGTATFSVAATSGTALKYQWRFGTAALAGKTNSTLTLNNVNAANAGTYSVVVSATGAASKTNSATLTVKTPVSSTPLTNLTRFVGSIAIFSTTPSGTGPFSYVWKKNNSVIAGQTGSKLTLSNVQVSDSAAYTVVVSGACGSVTNSAFLDVDTCFPSVDVALVLDRSGSMTGKPYNDARLAATNFVRNLHLGGTNEDQAALVSYNSSTTLDRILTNSLPSLERGIAAIPAADGYTCITCGIQTGQNELASARHKSNALPVLVLLSDGLPTQGDTPSAALAAATQAKNAGTRIFTVGLGDVDHALMRGIASATNDYYYATNSSQLAALFDAISTVICRPPTNIFGPSNTVVCSGAAVTLRVEASGCDAFTYQWRKDGATLAGQTNSALVLGAVTPANAGAYSVVVTSVCRVQTNSATLTVNAPATIGTPVANQTGVVGSDATFTVNATGTALTYQWRFNGTLVGTNSTLALNNLGTNSAGTYCVRVASAVCGSAVTNCATLTIQNRAPAANNDSYTIAEDSVLTIAAPGVLVNDTDPDGDTLTALLVVAPSHGTLTLNPNGSFTYRPAANYNGSDTFTYRATDGTATSGVATVSIAVTPGNDAPVARDDNYSTPSGTTLTIAAPGVLANDTDVENSPLSAIRASNPANGTLTLSANGSFVYVPNPNYSGSDSFTYRAADLSATSGVATVTITVVPAPVVVITPPVNQTNCPGSTASFNVSATGTAITYQWLFGTNILAGQTNSALVLPNVSATNAGPYCVIVNGATGGPLTNCAVLVVNQNVIVVTPPSSQTNCPSTTATFGVSATGTALAYQWYFGANSVVLAGQTNSTLTVTNVTETSAGVYRIVVSGTCGVPVTNSATLTVNQNVTVVNPPVSRTSFVGSNVVFSVGATGTGLIYRWTFNGQVIGTNSTLTINNLSTNQAGSYCVTVSGTCGIPVTTCTTLTIQNRAPVARDDSYSTPEDTALTISAPGVLGNDSDADGDTLSTILVTPPAHGTVTLNPNGSFTYRPATNYNGSDSFTYRASDGSATSGVATVSISVTTMGDAPTARDDAYSTSSDTTLSVNAPGVLANDTDVENDPLSAVLATNPMHGTLTLSANGSFVYVPTTNYFGSDTFTYKASDGSATSGVATVTISVVPTPIVIITPPPNQTNCPGGTAVFTVTTTGTAPTYQWFFGTNALSGQTNRTLTLNNVGATNEGPYCVVVNGAAGGPITNCAVLVVNQNIIVTTPPANQVVCQSSTAEFNITATGTALTYQWYQGVAATILTGQTNRTLTLSNVTTAHTTVYTIVVSGACGVPVTNSATLTVNTPVVITTGPTNQTSFVGSNTVFSVVASGTGLRYQWTFNGTLVGTNSTLALNNLTTNRAGLYCVIVSGTCGGPVTNCNTLTIQNRAPVANNDSYTIAEDATLTMAAPGILGNDIDVDGDALRAVLVSSVSHGTLNLNASGAFVYTPGPNYNGADTFTYRATDGSLVSGVATVTIAVTPSSDAPMARDDAYTTPEDTALVIGAPGVLVNDSDSDGDALRALLADGPTNGVVTLNTNGSFVYMPDADYNGPDHFTYRASDGSLTSAVVTVTIVVTPVNDRPMVTIISPTNGSTYIAPANFNVIADANDADGAVTNVQIFSGTNLMGTFTNAPYFVPRTSLPPGIYSYYATATDNEGLRATSSVVMVTVTSSPPVTALGPIVLNRQNGLFEQFVRVSNPTPQDFPNGMRVFAQLISDNPSHRVWNATGTNASGVAFVDSSTPLPSGGFIDILIQYYLPEPRSVPTILLTAEPLPFAQPAIPQPKIMSVSRTADGAMVEFTTSKQNMYYYLQRSDDLVHWTTIPALLRGDGQMAHGYDVGTAPRRFYRAIVIP